MRAEGKRPTRVGGSQEGVAKGARVLVLEWLPPITIDTEGVIDQLARQLLSRDEHARAGGSRPLRPPRASHANVWLDWELRSYRGVHPGRDAGQGCSGDVEGGKARSTGFRMNALGGTQWSGGAQIVAFRRLFILLPKRRLAGKG